MSNVNSLNDLIAEISNLPDLIVLNSLTERERFSRDFYEYSPVLFKKLKGCCADLVVRPLSVKTVMSVASLCTRYQVPLTVRGSGTGNYGQSVPLEKGVVILMDSISKIRKFDLETGAVTVETGCLLADLNRYLVSNGRQLRLTPSTWKSASVGGFIAGGSGGIGSVRWGFLRDPGHLLGLEIVTMEDVSKTLQLDGNASEALNHAYGTNGIITALTLATAPDVSWLEIAIDCADWAQAVELQKRCTNAAINLNLCCLLEDKIVQKLPNWLGLQAANHRLLILAAPDGISSLERLACSVGASFKLLGYEKSRNGNGLRELSWNHTTLHMRSLDPGWTYLQMLLPEPELQAMEELKLNWGDDLLWHLESVRHLGAQRVAALPLVRWSNEDELEMLISQCRRIGAIIFNPHVITVEDGGLGVIDSDQVDAKRRFDPNGLLNPGKLKGWLK